MKNLEVIFDNAGSKIQWHDISLDRAKALYAGCSFVEVDDGAECYYAAYSKFSNATPRAITDEFMRGYDGGHANMPVTVRIYGCNHDCVDSFLMMGMPTHA